MNLSSGDPTSFEEVGWRAGRGVGREVKNAICITPARRQRSRRLESDLRFLDKLLGEKVESILSSGIDVVEALRQVRALFPPRAFRIQFEASRSLCTAARDVIAQAEERQKSVPGDTMPEPFCSISSSEFDPVPSQGTLRTQQLFNRRIRPAPGQGTFFSGCGHSRHYVAR